jgi:hypothetical protein
MNTSNNINKRAFVSCGLFITGFGLPVSAIINHFLILKSFTIQQNIWMSVNDVLAVLFIFFAVFHFTFHSKSFLRYLKSYSVKNIRKELVLASVLIFVLLFAVVFHNFGV